MLHVKMGGLLESTSKMVSASVLTRFWLSLLCCGLDKLNWFYDKLLNTCIHSQRFLASGINLILLSCNRSSQGKWQILAPMLHTDLVNLIIYESE
jgi:hypothetical protein